MSNKLTKNTIAVERGKRVKFLRSYIASMRGEDFAEYCGLARGTVTNWETGKGRIGLTEKGGNKIVKAMQRIGIHCTVEWLLDGVGDLPKIIDQNKLSRLRYPMLEASQSEYVREAGLYEHENFLEEVALFKQRYPAHLLYTFQDESMSPIYYPDDCVGGPRVIPSQLKISPSSICIVLIQPDQLLVRRVKLEGSENKMMSFYGVNAEASLEYPPMSHIPIDCIIAIAPVTRLWRNIKNF